MQKKVSKSPDHVIAISLYGNNPAHTYGAIRNAQIMPVFFPGWTLHIYIDRASNQHIEPPKSHSNSTENIPRSVSLHNITTTAVKTVEEATIKGDSKYSVPWLVLNKLQTLGARIITIDTHNSSPSVWPYLAIDEAKYVLVRRADSRVTGRDQMLVNNWIRTDSSLLYTREAECENKLPSGGNIAINTPYLKLKTSVGVYMEQQGSKATEENFLRDILEESTTRYHTCFDSLHCHENNCEAFPVKPQRKGEFFGQKYDIYDVPQLQVPTPKGECFATNATTV